jgi:clan AA aspartic protease
MITGEINPFREAIIRLTVRGPGGQEEEIDTILDTGFTDELTLHPAIIAALGLVLRGSTVGTLADGTLRTFGVYAAQIVWDGQDRSILVLEADGGPLVGMNLLYGFWVTLDVIDGGDVTIQPLP